MIYHSNTGEVISCQDRRDRTRIRKDGIYEIWIQGTQIRVYCYGMNFLEKPLEYLLLNDDNYSESINLYGTRYVCLIKFQYIIDY